MKIPTDTVKELREQSRAGIMECRNALLETEGDIEKALRFYEIEAFLVRRERRNA